MATTTPNYGWAVPTSTDLVKDGATAIETLGDAIDASMNTALGTKKAGMVLLNTTSFSAVASQSVNDVFNATYENYKLLFNIGGTGNLTFRFRISGTDASGADYYANNIKMQFTSTTVNGENQNAANALDLGSMESSRRWLISTDIGAPFLAHKTTVLFGNTMGGDFHSGAGFHNLENSYTGFTFLGTSMTGSVSVYGYNK
jgi:hypothetical protein